jgi:hypothetical protein
MEAAFDVSQTDELRQLLVSVSLPLYLRESIGRMLRSSSVSRFHHAAPLHLRTAFHYRFKAASTPH